MKDVTEALEKYLNEKHEIQCCDLYDLNVETGSHYYFTNADRDISYGGHLYEHNRFILERDQIQLLNQVQVDSLTVTISAGIADKITVADLKGNATEEPFLKAVNDGYFDRARLKLSCCFFNPINDTSLPAIVGAIDMFEGLCDVEQAGGMYVQFSIKSKTTGLNMQFPLRRYYPQGAYSIVGNGVAASDSSQNCVIAPFIPRKEVLI